MKDVGWEKKGKSMSKEIRVYMEPDECSEYKDTPGHWVELPIDEHTLELELISWTGSSWGTEYIISDYENPYYPIHPSDDIWIDNKAAELIEYLDEQGKAHLKKWCEKYEMEYPDATEVVNAVIQIYAILTTTKELTFEDIDTRVFPDKYGKREILEMPTELLFKKELGTLSEEEQEEYKKVLQEIKRRFELGYRAKRTWRHYEYRKKKMEREKQEREQRGEQNESKTN